MALPLVAIVGRPNVGKSSLFNALAGLRASIVESTPGVTRDRVSHVLDIDDHWFELVDTGGYGIVDRDDLGEHVERQIRFAISAAHLILFVVDARDGLTPLDQEIADMLRADTERVRVIANKVDDEHLGYGAGEFAQFGYGAPLCVSAVTGFGRNELLELVKETVASVAGTIPEQPVLKLALVGKRNAGKSTFLNALAGEERVIVSEIPGTTRDSIDVRIEKDGHTLLAIDTAGMRKRRKFADDVEYYAFTRATNAITRADIALFLIDATVPIGQVDKHLSKLIGESFKPCIFVVNKWDLVKGRASVDDFGDYLTKALPHVSFAPLAFTSANTGRNVAATIDLATELAKQARTRVGTGKLNQALQTAVARQQPKAHRGRRRPKVYYATQVSTNPPTIVVFVNNAKLISRTYERYLLNRFREHLPFDEVPIRLLFRSRRTAEAPL